MQHILRTNQLRSGGDLNQVAGFTSRAAPWTVPGGGLLPFTDVDEINTVDVANAVAGVVDVLTTIRK